MLRWVSKHWTDILCELCDVLILIWVKGNLRFMSKRIKGRIKVLIPLNRQIRDHTSDQKTKTYLATTSHSVMEKILHKSIIMKLFVRDENLRLKKLAWALRWRYGMEIQALLQKHQGRGGCWRSVGSGRQYRIQKNDFLKECRWFTFHPNLVNFPNSAVVTIQNDESISQDSHDIMLMR
jgi:hypothetical protein